MTGPAVVVEDLHVAYGTTWALDGVDVDVPAVPRSACSATTAPARRR